MFWFELNWIWTVRINDLMECALLINRGKWEKWRTEKRSEKKDLHEQEVQYAKLH
jgi:hypothetical protein